MKHRQRTVINKL